MRLFGQKKPYEELTASEYSVRITRELIRLMAILAIGYVALLGLLLLLVAKANNLAG